MSRPEHTGPPDLFYNETEAKKYTINTRIQAIQAEMTYRALELLALPEDKTSFVLDIGCGSGLSGECIQDDGHVWVGVDVSKSMLDVANEREVEGDLFLQDIGQGFGFRPGTFDGAISISVIQWLCHSNTSAEIPQKRLARFFNTLYSSLCRGARAVFQFYPENPAQVEMIVTSAMKAGFTGGLVVDYPNSSKAKKYFLCLFAGYRENPSSAPKVPQGLTDEGHVEYASERIVDRRSRKKKTAVKDKNWVVAKKEAARKKGKSTANDSKYTARKRKTRF